jgi:hypothetical protein
MVSRDQVGDVVFISHATSDREIARALIGVLNIIPGISERIYCTSVEGYEIAPGRSWLENIRAQLAHSALTIFVITQQFLGRQFCQFELGAVWAYSDEDARFPLLFPPLDHADVGPILGSWQLPRPNERSFELLVERAAHRLNLPLPSAVSIGPGVRTAVGSLARFLEQDAVGPAQGTDRTEPYACTIKTTQKTVRQVDVTYPVVTFTGGPRTEGMTRLFESEISATINSFIAEWADRPFTLEEGGSAHNSFITIDADIPHISSNLLSVLLTTVDFTGGANPAQHVSTLNLDPHSGGHLGLGDLLGLAGRDLERFSKPLTSELQTQAQRHGDISHGSAHPGRPYRYDTGLGFAFNKYEIAAGAAGIQQIRVSDLRLQEIAESLNLSLKLLA